MIFHLRMACVRQSKKHISKTVDEAEEAMNHDRPLLESLKKVEVFHDLDEQTLRLLQETMQLLTFKPDEVICAEGDKGDRMYVLESGQISVLKRGQDGTPVEITVLQPGEIAGEMSLFGEAVRSATLRARGETKIWFLDYGAFQAVLEQHGNLAKALLSRLSRHLRRETSVVAKLLSRDADRRLKVAFFDSKPYSETVFQEGNRYNYAFQFFEPRLSAETAYLAAGAKVICAFVNDKLDADVVEELHDMGIEMIALRCAGYNNVDLASCQRHGITVVRVPAYSPYAVAEHAVALMLALNRRTHRAHNRVREGNFSLTGLVGFDMHGKTAGIIGTGKIGKCVLNILAGFGCRLLAYDVYPDAPLVERLGVRFVPIDELLAQSDIISLHAPLTPETRHLINHTAIAKMKRGVMLINTSRGALIETRSLLAGLKSGQIGYAGLDVYEEESAYFFEDHSDRVITDDLLARLTTFNNVMITSHQGFLTQEALRNIADITVENIREFELGKRQNQLTNWVPS